MPDSADPTGVAESVNEQSPLLGKHQSGGSEEEAEERGTVAQPGNPDGEDATPLADEPSTRKLVLVLSSLWLGVFFAAAGSFAFCTALPSSD